MNRTGADVFREVAEFANRARTRLEADRAAQREADDRIELLLQDRGTAFVELARVYLPQLSHNSVQSTWKDVRTQVQDVLRRRDIRLQQLEKTTSRLTASLAADTTRLTELKEQMKQLTTDQSRLQKLLSRQLSDDERFQKYSQQAAIEEVSLERAEASMAQVEQDVAEKLPAYERSRLFQYLHVRQMGTPGYRARGLSRRLDHWVGRLIDYPKARQSYAFLTQVPERMRELIGEIRSSFESSMKNLEQRQNELSTEIGLAAITDQLVQAQSEQTTLRDRHGSQSEESERLSLELSALGDGQGPFYDQAIDRFTFLLQKTETLVLAERAEQSLTPDDDRLVERIQSLTNELTELRRDVEERRIRLKREEKGVRYLTALVQRFDELHYNTDHTTFERSLDLVHILEKLRRGAENLEWAWQRIRREENTPPHWIEERADAIAGAAGSPMGQILMTSMVEAAGGALRAYAHRAGQRHTKTGGG